MSNASQPKKKRGPGRPKNPVSRDDLLSAALAAFSERGYAGASMSDIAARGGIQKSSLFHHFPSKDELYLEVLSSALSELGELVAEASADTETDFWPRFEALTDSITAFLARRAQIPRLIIRELVDHGPFWRGPGAEAAHVLLQSSASFLRQGMPEGTSQVEAAHAVMSMTGTHILYWAASDISQELIGGDIFSEAAIAQRMAVVRRQVRAILAA
jgi:AcrR family transcriptional regulator